MEIGYQVGSMKEFECGDPFGFVSSIFISQPDHLIQEFACLLAINFRIHYLRNFIFGFSVNYDQSGGQLYSLGESIGCNRFKHGHMEDWINRAYGLWKMESEQQSTKLGNNFVGSEIFFREFLSRPSGSEELSFDKDFVTYFEIRSRGISYISGFLITLLGHGDFSFKSTL